MYESVIDFIRWAFDLARTDWDKALVLGLIGSFFIVLAAGSFGSARRKDDVPEDEERPTKAET